MTVVDKICISSLQAQYMHVYCTYSVQTVAAWSSASFWQIQGAGGYSRNGLEPIIQNAVNYCSEWKE